MRAKFSTIFRIVIFGIVAIAALNAALAADAGPPFAPPGSRFRDCPHCPEMTIIPAGHFSMGTTSLTSEADGREGPPHEVVIRSFAMGIYDVRVTEYAAFVRETRRRDTGPGCNIIDPTGRWIMDKSRSWHNPGFPQTGNDPVVCVSWEDAQAYVQWLNGKVRGRGDTTGGLYRLPTEAEWEYSARAGSHTPYFWGEEDSHEQANYGLEQCPPCGALKAGRDRWYFTSPVDAFPPNPFGLHDALGNVWQWTEDCMHWNYKGAPSDGAAWTSGDCGDRVLRGGSWVDPAKNITVTIRNPWPQGDHNQANGFRVARSAG